MKKLRTVLTSALMCTMFSTTILAAGSADVWEEAELTKEGELVLSVETNGKATDGMVEIQYDKDAMSVSEKDITIAEDVDMYSLNLEDENVKLAYLSAKAMGKGTVVTVNFEIAKECLGEDKDGDGDFDVDDLKGMYSVKLSANKANGEALKTSLKPADTEAEETETEEETEVTEDTEETETEEETEVTEDTEETEKPEDTENSDDEQNPTVPGNQNNQNQQNPSVSQNTVTAATSAKTNDTANFAPAILLLSAGVLVIASVFRKRKTH